MPCNCLKATQKTHNSGISSIQNFFLERMRMLTCRHNRQNVWKHFKNLGILLNVSYSCSQASHIVGLGDGFLDAIS